VSTGTKTGKKRSKSATSSIVELVLIIAVALGLALGIQAFIIKPYRIPSGSMEPTLAIGQRVLVNRIGMNFSDPHVGEIAVFHPPRDAEQQVCGPVPHVVKVGGPACSQPEPVRSNVNFIKIPPGHWFMMGDNRGESDDSRFWGPVPTGWIIGGAFATYWPIDRIGIL
jgi:signal peptidase I